MVGILTIRQEKSHLSFIEIIKTIFIVRYNKNESYHCG